LKFVFIADFGSFIFYNASSQHSIFDEVLEADEHADLDHHEDVAKPKFTFTECLVAIALSLAIVTMLAIFLVVRIEDVVEAGIPDQFLGLIMLPLVEKAAEHLTAVDEAWDGQIVRWITTLSPCLANIPQNFALFHCIGPSIQTALFNAPLVVVVGWALGKDMDLNFEIFMIVLLVLSIVVVGNFLRDGESNYLEGSLLVVSNDQDVEAAD
jgi:Ca2+:H+ antiporter